MAPRKGKKENKEEVQVSLGPQVIPPILYYCLVAQLLNFLVNIRPFTKFFEQERYFNFHTLTKAYCYFFFRKFEQ